MGIEKRKLTFNGDFGYYGVLMGKLAIWKVSMVHGKFSLT